MDGAAFRRFRFMIQSRFFRGLPGPVRVAATALTGSTGGADMDGLMVPSSALVLRNAC